MTGRRVLAVVLVAALLVAGCASPGGDGQPREGPGDGASTAGPGGTPAGGPTATRAAPNGSNASSTAPNASSTAPNATPTRAAAEVPPPEVVVRLNCTALRVTVTPDVWTYRLYLRYRDTVTGKQRRIAAGFFSGTVTDHFGPTDFVLVAVEVRVTGFGPVLRTRPTRCEE